MCSFILTIALCNKHKYLFVFSVRRGRQNVTIQEQEATDTENNWWHNSGFDRNVKEVGMTETLRLDVANE